MHARKGLLIHVAVDKLWSDGGFYGPLEKANLFEYIPIPECTMREKKKNTGKYYPVDYLEAKPGDETYGNSKGERLGKYLSQSIHPRHSEILKNVSIHHDPSFEHNTYGEGKKHSPRGKVCAKLEEDNLLVFCSSLENYETGEHGQFIIGYFTVADKYDFTNKAEKKLRKTDRERVLSLYRSKNAHFTKAFARSYGQSIEELRNEYLDEREADLVLIVGKKGKSGLLKKAIRLTNPCKKKVGKKMTNQSFYMTRSLVKTLGLGSTMFHMGFKWIPPDYIRNLEKLLERGNGFY